MIRHNNHATCTWATDTHLSQTMSSFSLGLSLFTHVLQGDRRVLNCQIMRLVRPRKLPSCFQSILLELGNMSPRISVEKARSSSTSAATWKSHLSSGRKFEQDGFLLLKGFASKDEPASQLTGVLWKVDLSLLSPLKLL